MFVEYKFFFLCDFVFRIRAFKQKLSLHHHTPPLSLSRLFLPSSSLLPISFPALPFLTSLHFLPSLFLHSYPLNSLSKIQLEGLGTLWILPVGSGGEASETPAEVVSDAFNMKSGISWEQFLLSSSTRIFGWNAHFSLKSSWMTRLTDDRRIHSLKIDWRFVSVAYSPDLTQSPKWKKAPRDRRKHYTHWL